MPGNPGTSLRCNECRKRKKKCDFQRPHCLRCRKSGIMCSGPREHQPFIHRQADEFHQQTQRQALLGSIRGVWAQNRNTRVLYAAFQDHNRAFLQAVARNQWQCVVTPSLNLDFGPVSLFCAAVLDEFRVGKPTGIFSADRVQPKSTKEPRVYSSVALSLRALSKMITSPCPTSLRVAAFGVLILYIGRLKGDDALLQKARQLYTRSLGFARTTLNALAASSDLDRRNGQVWYHAACLSIALQFFEFIDCIDSGSAKFVHGKGAIAIMARVEPAEFSLPETKPLLQGFRALAIYHAVADRRPSVLVERGEWCNASSDGPQWAPRQHLIGIAADIPRLLSHTDDFILCPVSDDVSRAQAVAKADQIVKEMLHTHDKFKQWLRNLESSYEGPLFWNVSETIPSTPELNDTKCLPTQKTAEAQLEFLSSPVAGLLVTYWAFRLKLWMTAIDIRNRMLIIGANPNEVVVDIEDVSRNCRKAVSLILEAAPYLSSCLEGSLVLQAPFKLVEEFVEKYWTFRNE